MALKRNSPEERGALRDFAKLDVGCEFIGFRIPLSADLRSAKPRRGVVVLTRAYDGTMIDHELVGRFTMAMTTISPKFQIVIPKEVRDKLRLSPRQRLQVVEKGGVITLVPEVPLKSLKGVLKGMSKTDVREKKDRV